VPARKLKVTIRRFRAHTLSLGGVELGALRLEEERAVEASGDPIDVMVRVAEEEGRTSKWDYVEVVVDDGETRRVWGAGPRYTWSRPLSYRPEPLLRVGIVRRAHMRRALEQQAGEGSEPSGGEPAAFRVDLQGVEWHIPQTRGLYVFEGKAQLSDEGEDVELVAVETPSGVRLLRPSPASSRRQRSS